MKKHLPIIISIMLSVLGCVLFTNVLLFANEQSKANITITATVRPVRIIVVDETLTITKVISNTNEDVRPMVVLGKSDGPELAFSDAIYSQYEKLKPTLNFSRPGVLYERDNRPAQALIKSLLGRISKLISSPV